MKKDINLFEIGAAIMDAAKFESMYYNMEEDRDYWKNKYLDFLDQSTNHNKEMIGNLLTVALKMGEEK